MTHIQRPPTNPGRFRAFPFAIHDSAVGGRTMYHMIHATDHPDASPLMLRAYRKVAGRRDWDRPIVQADLLELFAADDGLDLH